MNYTKNPFFVASLVLSVLGAASSCSRDATPKNPTDASFIVDQPIGMVKSEQSATNPEWSIPSQNSMTFSACIKDVAKLAPVIGQNFTVRSDNASIQVTTNAEGCFNWSENIAFNYLQDETYVQSNHTIEGLGPYQGSRDVNLALDPWKTSGDAMIDLRQSPEMQKLVHGQSLLDALKSAIVSGSSKPALVKINQISLESNDIRYDGNAAAVDLHVNVAPMLTRTDLTGNVVNEPIMQGKFNLKLSLTERVQTGPTSGANDQLLLLAENTLQGKLDPTGHLILDTTMSLKRMPNPASIVELAYVLTPEDSSYPLSADMGLARLGSITSLKGQNTLSITHPDIPAYLSQAEQDTQSFALLSSTSSAGLNANSTASGPATPGNSTAVCKDGSDELGFYISAISVQWTGVKTRTANEQVPSQVIAGVSVCLNNSIDRSPLTGRVFDANFQNSAMQTLTADNQGCIRWNEIIDFDYFSPEKWIQKNLHIASESAPFQNVTRDFPVYVDPWQNDQTFFWDCRKGSLPTFQSKPAQIELSDFNYNFVGRDLNIDSNLNLTVTHRLQVELTPQFHRSVGFGGLSTYETVNDGNYHLRLVLLSPNHDESISMIEGASNADIISNFKYLSSFESDVQTRNGRIITEIPLPIEFSAVPLLSTRNVVLIQLSSTDSSSTLLSQPFYSPILTNSDTGIFGLTPSKGVSTYQSNKQANSQLQNSKLNLDALIATGKASLARNTFHGSSSRAVQTQFGVKEATLSQLQSAGITPAVIRTLLSSSKVSPANAIKLCTLVGNSPATCSTHAQGSFEILRTAHVESVSGTPQVVSSNYRTFSLSASMTFSEGTSQSLSKGDGTSTNASLATDVGGGFNFFSFFKAGADASLSKGKNWFNTTTSSNDSGVSNSQSSGLSRSFSVEQMTFSIPTSHHQCLSVRGGKNQLMICENTGARSESLTETYAVITELLGYQASTFRDPHSITDSPWVKVVRGAAGLDSVLKTLSDQSKKLLLTPVTQSALSAQPGATSEDNFAKTAPDNSDGAIPGMSFLSKLF